MHSTPRQARTIERPISETHYEVLEHSPPLLLDNIFRMLLFLFAMLSRILQIYWLSHGEYEVRVAWLSVSLQVFRFQALLVVAEFLSPVLCLSVAKIHDLTLLKALAESYIVLQCRIMKVFLLLLLE